MKAVVDTNVIAYYLLGTPDFLTETSAFWRKPREVQAPAQWEAELANVVWMSARTGVVAEPEAVLKLRRAAALGIHSVATRSLWQGALVRALALNISVYDALFVELADRKGLPLATFDAKLIDACPAIAVRPRELLEG